MSQQHTGKTPGAASSLFLSSKKALGTILVIDDSEVVRAHLRELLTEAGAAVLELSSAIGASLKILRNEVSAVVIDISMPGLSGDRLVEVLRGNPKFDQVALVVVTGRSGHELEALRSTVPADAILSKEEVRSRLVLTLLEAIQHRTQGEKSHRA